MMIEKNATLKYKIQLGIAWQLGSHLLYFTKDLYFHFYFILPEFKFKSFKEFNVVIFQ